MNEELLFRKAAEADAGRIWLIIRQAKEQMKQLGSKQWQDGYPMLETINEDITLGNGYVLCQEGTVIAYGAVIFTGEPAYDDIVGNWMDDAPYVVVHRLAVGNEAKQRGIASYFMQQVEELSCRNGVFRFRVDTNFDNMYMHQMLDRLDFSYCGEVRYRKGWREAFEKRLQ